MIKIGSTNSNCETKEKVTRSKHNSLHFRNVLKIPNSSQIGVCFQNHFGGIKIDRNSRKGSEPQFKDHSIFAVLESILCRIQQAADGSADVRNTESHH